MANKFKTGDRVRVGSSDRVGYLYATIMAVTQDYGAVSVYFSYVVTWDHHPGRFSYTAEEVEDVWELICPTNPTTPMTLPTGNTTDSLDTNIPTESSKIVKNCDHKWVNYHGLQDSYQFCKICDEKRSM